jgi:hypothetical protein
MRFFYGRSTVAVFHQTPDKTPDKAADINNDGLLMANMRCFATLFR